MREFIEKHRLRMTFTEADGNPGMAGKMPAGSMHYRITLRRGRKSMTTHYSHGPAVCHDPDLENILVCLQSESSSVAHGQTFEEWAPDYGFDTDSREAEATYKATAKQCKRLRAFLAEAWDDFLAATET